MSDTTEAVLSTKREAVYAAIPASEHARLWPLISELEYAVIEDVLHSLRIELSPAREGGAAYVLVWGDEWGEVEPAELPLRTAVDNTLETYRIEPDELPEDIIDARDARHRLAHALWAAANRLDADG